jgi:hypothetical protein
MRMRLARRVLQVLLVPILIFHVVQWAWNPKHGHLAYLGWSTFFALVILLLGPWWIDRPKREAGLLDRRRNLGMAVLIYGLFLATAMPIVTIWAVLWAGISLYAGGLLVLKGELAAGLVYAGIPLLGTLGLYSLWSLARFYVRAPRETLPKAELIWHGVGVCAGLGVVIFIWTIRDVWKWGDLAFSYVAVACLSPLVITLFFLALALFNWICPPRASPLNIAQQGETK